MPFNRLKLREIKLPESKQPVSLEQQIAVEALNPKLTAITATAQLLAQAIKQKAERRKNLEMATKLSEAAGEPKALGILKDFSYTEQPSVLNKLMGQDITSIGPSGVSQIRGILGRKQIPVKETIPKTEEPQQIFYADRISGITRDTNGNIVTSVPKGSRIISLNVNEGASSKFAGVKKDITSALATVNQLKDAWERLRVRGMTGMNLSTAGTKIKGELQQDKDASSYMNLRKALVTFIGRNIGSDVGNFAVSEAPYYQNLMPPLYASDESAEQSFVEMQAILINKLKETENAYKSFGVAQQISDTPKQPKVTYVLKNGVLVPSSEK